MPRETWVRPLGLVTQPNEHGKYAPGSMSKCLNLMLRRPGVLEAMKDVEDYLGANDVLSRANCARLFPGNGATVALSYNTAFAYTLERLTSGDAPTTITWQPYGSSRTWSISRGKTHRARSRGRDFLSTDEGVAVLDAEDSTVARMAGLPAPTSIYLQSAASNGQAVATTKWRGYRAVFVRVHSDGYEQTGPPSHLYVYQNGTGGSTDPKMHIGLEPATRITLSASASDYTDYVELYATKTAATSAVGDRCYRVLRQAIVSGDLTNGYVAVDDTIEDDGLGEELYTNAGQKGGRKAYYGPRQACVDAVEYRGQTLYAGTTQRESYKTRIKGLTGTLATLAERTNGIGLRQSLAGTATSGNPTITGVSAADIAGVAVGQRVTGATFFSTGALVTAVGASTITFDENASGSGAESVTLEDLIEINGTTLSMASMATFAFDNVDVGLALEIQFSKPIGSVAPKGVSIELWGPSRVVTVNTIRATNGSLYEPALPDMDETALAIPNPEVRLDRVYYSEPNNPEAVPQINYFFVGDGEVLKLWPTEDALWAFCTDGLYRITGEGDSWNVSPFDVDLRLFGRCAVDSMMNTLYAFTNRGLVAISTAMGVQDISEPLIGDDVRSYFESEYLGSQLDGSLAETTFRVQVACDVEHREVWLQFGYAEYESGTFTSKVWVYNARNNAFWNWEGITNPAALCYAEYESSMIFSAHDSSGATIHKMGDEGDDPVVDIIEAKFQPMDGGESFLAKEWIGIDWLIRAESDLSVKVGAAGATYNDTLVDVIGEQVFHSEVGRERATESYIEPYIYCGDVYDSVNSIGNFKLYGVSPRFEHIAQQVSR